MNQDTEQTTAPAAPVSPLRRAFAQKRFAVAVAVLALAAVGLNASATALKLHFQKIAVELRHPLADPKVGLPDELGPWAKVSQQDTLDPDIQHALGTKEFVFRTYVDTRVVGRAAADAMRSRPAGEVAAALGRIQQEHPEAVVSLAITYYTGMVDTVAHIPDRCMVSDGYEPKDPGTRTVAAGAYPGGRPREVTFQFTTFEDQTGSGRVSKNIGYFFHCNGAYAASPLDVRYKLQRLTERHGYYAKVELMTVETGTRATIAAARGDAAQKAHGAEAAAASMTDLMTHALPELERCLPDWDAVKAGAAAPVRPAVAAR